LDDNDKPLGNYNLCVSKSFEEEVTCTTALKLIKYDKDSDLALLELVDKKIDL
jgi:hypothetical protein